MKTKKSYNPLLYIQQPNWGFPIANMQQTYYVKNAELKQVKSTLSQSKKDSATNETDAADQVNSEELVHEVANILIKNNDSQNQILESKDVQNAIVQYEQERQTGKNPSLIGKQENPISYKHVKSFKEMNIVEKLDYLLHFPKLLPPVPCIFITGDNSIRGFLVKKIEDTLEVKTFDDRVEQISINELTQIKMLGFK